MLVGLSGALSRLDELVRNFDDAVQDELEETAFRVLEDSRKLAPVDTGYMSWSSKLEFIDPQTMGIHYPADYSVYVHENMEAYHPNGKAKFLEIPLKDHVKRHFTRMTARLRTVK